MVKPNQIWDTMLSTEQGIMLRLQHEIRQDYTITRIGRQMTEVISILGLVFEQEEYEWPLSVPATIINVTDMCICINFEATEFWRMRLHVDMIHLKNTLKVNQHSQSDY